MSGSGASNLGYGNITPNSNVDPAFVNKGAMNQITFSSNEDPSLYAGLRGTSYNVNAAAGKYYGGSKNKNNILYKMTRRLLGKKHSRKHSRRHVMKGGFVYDKSSLKKNTKSLKSRRNTNRRSSKRKFSLKGGTYHQFLSNTPYSQGYSAGGNLPPSLSALANPAPYTPYFNLN
jgi:hypothetical protein